MRCLSPALPLRSVLFFGLACVLLTCSNDEPAQPACELSIVSPKGEEILVQDSTYAIRWTSDGPCGGSVRIELIWESESGSAVLASATENDGAFDWRCDRCCGDASGSGYRIRVTDRETGKSAVSPKSFAIALPLQLPPACRVSPAILDFDTLLVGQTAERTFTITNIGGGALPGSVGAAGQGFAILSGGGAFRLGPGESHSATIRFAPATDGAFECTIDTGPGLCADARCVGIGEAICAPRVTSPAAGDSWCAGTRRTIAWSRAASCGDEVAIELLRNGALAAIVAERAPNTGSFEWDPVAGWGGLTSGYAIRVTDLASGARGTSRGAFTIPIACTLEPTAPAAGEDWCAGSTRTITWVTGACCGPEVRIELLRAGRPCSTIAERAPNVGRFVWNAVTRCDEIDDGYRIRVTDVASQVSGTTPGDFSITRACELAVTAPRDGESWREASRQTIAWIPGACCGPVVTIELLRAGAPCLTIADRAPNDGRHLWNPVAQWGEATDDYQIRITDPMARTAASSPGSFRIPEACALAVLTPAGRERWCTGESRTVTWSAGACTGAEVKIELLLEGGSCVTIADRAPNTGRYTWNPVVRCDSVSYGYRVRVTDIETSISDHSPEIFSIAGSCRPEVSAPGDGDRWCQGSSRTIAWTPPPSWGPEVGLDLLRNGAFCRTIAARTRNDGNFSWDPVARCGDFGDGYSIRVTDLASSTSAVSTGAFGITSGGAPVVLAPAGGERWCAGSSVAIVWDPGACCGPEVRIGLLHDGALCATIAARTPNDGRFTWDPVDACGAFTEGLAVQVTDPSTGASAVSPGTFAISPAGSLTVVSPDGDERWCEGSARAISWTASACSGEEVRIELLREGTLSAVLAASTPNDGEFVWESVTRAGVVTDGYRVRVVDPTPGASDMSNAAFRIEAACRIAVTTPEIGDRWPEGASRTIAWSAGACCGVEVAIDLLLDGTPCASIAERTPNDGSFLWAPIAPCGNTADGYGIRITDLTTGAFGEARGGFVIADACRLEVTAPDGGELWCEGSRQAITWETGDSCGAQVSVELLRNGQPCRTLAAAAPNNGRYEWESVARYAGGADRYTIRVTDLETQVRDVSRRSFTIPEGCTLALLSPHGGEVWCAGTRPTIRWNTGACCGSVVRIELLHDGTACATIAANAPNTGSLVWDGVECCEGSAEGYAIRVTSLETGASDAGPGSFSIRASGAPTITSPNGGERWCAGRARTITWTVGPCSGPVVDIELLRNGVACAAIANTAPNTGAFQWAPVERCDGQADGYTIRVTDPASGAADASDAGFDIKEACAVRVMTPNGGEYWPRTQRRVITWDAGVCCGAEVGIELLLGGAPCQTIAEATPNDGSFAWDPVTRCNVVWEGYTIRLVDLETGTSDSSDNPFKIPEPPAVEINPSTGSLVR